MTTHARFGSCYPDSLWSDQAIITLTLHPIEPQCLQHGLIIKSIQVNSLLLTSKMLVSMPRRYAKCVAPLPSVLLTVDHSVA